MKEQIIPVTVEEMKKLMDVIESEDDFDYMFFLTLKLTGRRIGELYGVEEKKIVRRKKVGTRKVYINGKPYVTDKIIPMYARTNIWKYGVKVKDVDLEKRIMMVWVLKRRKLEQDETNLKPKLAGVIRRYINRNRLSPEDYLFRKPGRGYRMIQTKIKQYAEKAAIGHKVSVHNFRHYLITQLKRNGWSNDKIAKITGHRNASVVSIYDHVLPSELRTEFERDTED